MIIALSYLLLAIFVPATHKILSIISYPLVIILLYSAWSDITLSIEFITKISKSSLMQITKYRYWQTIIEDFIEVTLKLYTVLYSINKFILPNIFWGK